MAEKQKEKEGKKVKEDEEQGPTERELFEIKVEQLRRELKTSDERLARLRADLAFQRDLYEKQVNSKEACVSHLKRVLKDETERRIALQDTLQRERDLAELEEVRFLDKMASLERTREAARSVFLRQKAELEGKLSLLEGRRLERNSQRTHLKRAEGALEEKLAVLRVKDREEDSKQAERLLSSREKFRGKCEDTRAQWKSAFDLRLSVDARKQLEENARLRYEGETATSGLLSEQKRSMMLTEQQNVIDLEEEIQVSVDEYAARRRTQQEAQRHLQSEALGTSQDVGALGEGSPPEDVSKCLKSLDKTKSIRDLEMEHCRLTDKIRDVEMILRDQEQYKRSLERSLAANVERNGVMMSTILSAGKILQTRCGRAVQDADFDDETLQQLRLLLDVERKEQVAEMPENEP